eukprot:233524-Amphidinium_carterae.1
MLTSVKQFWIEWRLVLFTAQSGANRAIRAPAFKVHVSEIGHRVEMFTSIARHWNCRVPTRIITY